MANKRKLITFQKKDDDIHDKIEKIVKVKNLAGIRTTFSFELIRLAKNGLFGTTIGALMDRKIL